MLDAVLGTRMGHGLPHQLVVSVGMDDKLAARDDRTAFEDPAHPRLPYVQPRAGDRPAAPCPAEAYRWVPCRPPSRPWHCTVEGSVVLWRCIRPPPAVSQPGRTGQHRPALAGPRRRRHASSSRPRRRGTPMACDCKTPDDVLKLIRDEKVEMIDLRFTDLPGLWQHFSVPPSALDADGFAAGVG